MKIIISLFLIFFCTPPFQNTTYAHEATANEHKIDIKTELNTIQTELKQLKTDYEYEIKAIDLRGQINNADTKYTELEKRMKILQDAINFHYLCLKGFMLVVLFLLVTSPVALSVYFIKRTKKLKAEMDKFEAGIEPMSQSLKEEFSSYIDAQSNVKLREITGVLNTHIEENTAKLSTLKQHMNRALSRFYTTLAVHMDVNKEGVRKVIEFQQTGLKIFIDQFGEDLSKLKDSRKISLLAYWQNLSYFYAKARRDDKRDYAINKAGLAYKYASGEEIVDLEEKRRLNWIDTYLYVLMRYDVPTKREEWKKVYKL